MPDLLIKGLYEIKTDDSTKAILISVSNENDPLKFDYYILADYGSKKEIPFIKISSPISIARDTQYNIHRIEQENNRYQELINRFTSSHIKGLYSKAISPRLIRKPNKNRA